MNEKVTSPTAALEAKIDALNKKVLELEGMQIKSGTYKQLQESIGQIIQQNLQGPRLNDVILERVRSMSLGRDDITAYITRSAQEKMSSYLNGADGKALLQDTILQHAQVRHIIDANLQEVLKKREFVAALSSSFRAAIVAEPLQLAALTDELAKDEKGLLASSLKNNQAFMDKHSQNILTWLRDSLST